MKLSYNYNGFHGSVQICFRVPDNAGAHHNKLIPVSDAVARRLNKAVCGMRGCLCREKIATKVPDAKYSVRLDINGDIVNPDAWYVILPFTVDYYRAEGKVQLSGEWKGNYPQY